MALHEQRRSQHPLRGAARQRQWHPLGKVLAPPAVMRSWLLARGSLTQKLQGAYGTISVRVLQQQTGCALLDEGYNYLMPVVVRDVVLAAADQKPLVIAHSILPLCPRGALSLMLKGLGRQALGSVLFTRPGFVRSQREWALLDRRDPLWQKAAAVIGSSTPPRLWARRAVFSPLRMRTQAVQVTEVFCFG